MIQATRNGHARSGRMPSESEFRELSPEDADAQFRQFLLERPAALQRLELNAAAAGVELDRTVRSLEPLWRWITSMLSEKGRDEHRESDPSWLIRGHPADRLSTSSVVLLDGLISYIGEVFASQTGHGWELERADDRSVTFQQFVFAGGLFVPVNVVNAALRRWSDTGDADEQLMYWVGASVANANASASGPENAIDVAVEPSDVPGFDWQLWVDESAELQLGTALFALLEKKLAEIPGVTGVAHEDREIFLVQGTDLTPSRLELTARSVIEQAETQARAKE